MNKDFSNIDVHQLERDIRDFWNKDYTEMSEGEIGLALSQCLFQNQFSVRKYSNIFMQFNSSDRLFRVRKDISKLSDVIGDTNNFWCLPPKRIKEGRLNHEHEQILYASKDISTACLETGVKTDERFLLIEYEIIDIFYLISIQVKGRFQGNTEISRIYDDFFNQLMARTQEEKSGIYKVTNYIKDYLFGAHNTGGWIYESAKNRKLANVALKYPEIKEKIGVKNISIMEKVDEEHYIIRENYIF